MQKPFSSFHFAGGLTSFIAIVVGLALALNLGMWIGQGEFGKVMKVGTFILIVLFAIQLHRYFWHVALFLIFVDFSFRPWGFSFGAAEITCGLGCLVIALFSWQKIAFKRPPILEQGGAVLMQRALFVWLLYIGLHIYYTFKDPFRPDDFAAGNAAKSYFAMSVPLFLLFYFGRRPVGIKTTNSFFLRIAQLCLGCLAITIAIKLYELLTGMPNIYIPVLEGTDSSYTLRDLGPLAVLVGSVGLCAADARKNFRSVAWVYWPLVLFGLLGAVFSGGRAAVVTSFLFTVVVLFLRKRLALLLVAGGIGFVGIVVANVFADWINERASKNVRRSLQWVLVTKSHEAMGSIENSSEWRNELRSRAFEEWKSDPRIFWFGRATYGYGSEDEVAIIELGGYEGLMQTSLRRGATHNLLTDLLVAYGLVGTTIYLTMYLSIIYFVWRLHCSQRLSQAGANLTLVCFVGTSCTLLIGLIGGAGLPLHLIWFLILLTASLYTGSGLLRAVVRNNAPTLPRPALQPSQPASLPGRRGIAFARGSLLR